MNITDELRKWAGQHKDWHLFDIQLNAIADRIDRVHDHTVMSVMNDALYHANDKSMAELGWVRLPKDADGEYIHSGDVLDGYGKTIEVVEMRHGRSGWVLISRDGNGYADTFAFAHHKQTVEDVLREFGDWYAHTKGGCDEDGIIAEYAAKLRLAGDAE